jgi:glutamate/tyrosine decarboxylase-like PLP-dependent enzyme
MISDDCRLAKRLFGEAERHPELEAHTLGLSIATFRYVPQALRAGVGTPVVEEALNELNRAVQARLEREGEVFLSNAVIDGCYLLRGCIVNFRTTDDDVRAIPEIVARAGREAWAERTARRAP